MQILVCSALFRLPYAGNFAQIRFFIARKCAKPKNAGAEPSFSVIKCYFQQRLRSGCFQKILLLFGYFGEMVMSASMTIYCNSTNRLSLGFFLRELLPVFEIAACKNFLHERPRPSCSETDTLLQRSFLTFLYLAVHSANYQTDQNKLLTIVLIIEKQSHENLPELLDFMFCDDRELIGTGNQGIYANRKQRVPVVQKKLLW